MTFYPRSFLGLLLAGFTLVILPLVGALAYSAFSTERLAGKSRTAVFNASQAARASRSLVDRIAAIERVGNGQSQVLVVHREARVVQVEHITEVVDQTDGRLEIPGALDRRLVLQLGGHEDFGIASLHHRETGRLLLDRTEIDLIEIREAGHPVVRVLNDGDVVARQVLLPHEGPGAVWLGRNLLRG